MKQGLPKALAVGVLILALVLAWLMGPWLRLRSTDLWILRIGLALLAAVGFAAFWILYSRQVRQRVAGSAAGAQPGGPAEQIQLLARESEARLAGSKLGSSARLRNLPVILMIGEKGAAKTTTVIRSGLEPELLAGRAFDEGMVAPTHLVNLWLGQRTVFADWSGGLLTEPEARAEAIRRLAPAGAPRAAVVCVDAESFLRPGASEATTRHAAELRQALGEISGTWGINLPVYVLFTRLDRIPYFTEYAANLTNPEAALVLGATLPLETAPGAGLYREKETQRLTAAFQQLVFSLADRRPDMLSREHDDSRLPSIYQFPRELRKLRNSMVQFLVELGVPSQLRTNPFLRGFYFTGVRPVIVSDVPVQAPRVEQQPLLTDATGIFQSSRRAPEPAPVGASGRKVPQWVFLGHLFSDVVLRDGAALGSSSVSIRKDTWRRAGLAAAAALGLVFGIGWIVSFSNNQGLKGEVVRAAAGVSGAQPSLATLDELRVSLSKLAQWSRDGAPMSYRWGLYTGRRLYPAARKIYFEHFRSLLFKQTQNSLAGLVARPSGAEALGYRPVYDALKAYLITTSHPDKSTEGFLTPVLMDHWTKGRTPDAQQGELARRQFAFYSNYLRIENPYPSAAIPDATAVDTARKYLSRFAATETLYQAMLARASERFAAIRFNQQYPGSAETVRNNYPVPGAFTKGGWGFMQEAIKNPEQYFSGEKWVMGDQAFAGVDRAKLQAELQQHYRDDFLKTWREFLRNTAVVRYAGGIPDAAGKLTTLSGNSSPLLMALCVASQNTSVDVPEVATVFQPAQHVEPQGCQERLSAPSNAPYMEGLIKLQAALQQLSGNTGSEPLRTEAMATATAAQVAARQVAQNFRIDKEGQVQAVVQKILEDPILHAQAVLGAVPLAAVNSAGAGLCAQMRPLMAKYPFSAKAQAQASLAEVNGVFQPPAGAVWKLYEENLSKALLRQGSEFVPNPGAGLNLTPGFLNFFRAAAAVSNAMYKPGAPQPQLAFTLRPAPSDGVERVSLTINGQTHSGGPGSGAWQFTWPGARQEAKLIVKLAGGSELEYLSYPDQLWAVFSLFGNVDRWQGTGSDYRVEWVLRTASGPVMSGGKPVIVRFDLSMGGAPPILRPGYLGTLGCVSTVVR